MKGKIYKTGDSRKKTIAAVLYSVLAFIVAGLSLGLYFAFKGNAKTEQTPVANDVNTYTAKQINDIEDSVKVLLGIDGVKDDEYNSYTEREKLDYTIKSEVAINAAKVLSENKVSNDKVSAIVTFFKENTLKGSSILEAFEYTYGEEDILNIDVIDLLDISSDYFNFVQNFRETFNTPLYDENGKAITDKETGEEVKILSDDQIVNIVLDLINVALDARNENDEAFKDANNTELDTYINEIAEGKLAWEEKYGRGKLPGTDFYNRDTAFYSNLADELETLRTNLLNENPGSSPATFINNILSDEGIEAVVDSVREHIYDAEDSNYGWAFYTGETVFTYNVNYFNTEYRGKETIDPESNGLLNDLLQALLYNENNKTYTSNTSSAVKLNSNGIFIAKDSENQELFNTIIGNYADPNSVLGIFDKYVSEVIGDIISRTIADANLMRASLYAIENYLFNKAEEGFNEGGLIKSLTKFGIELEKSSLELTSFLNTTGLKDGIASIFEGTLNKTDVAKTIQSNVKAMKAEKGKDGKYFTVSEDLYSDLYTAQQDIAEVYNIFSVISLVSKESTLAKVGNLVEVINDAIGVVVTGVEDVESIINNVYDGAIGVMSVLSDENGALSVGFDAIEAFISDVAYARGIYDQKIATDEKGNKLKDENGNYIYLYYDDEGEETTTETEYPVAGKYKTKIENSTSVEYFEEFNGHLLMDLFKESGELPLAIIEILNGALGKSGAYLTDAEIQRAIEIIYYGIGVVNGIADASESGFSAMEYYYQIKKNITNVQNKSEEIQQWTDIVRAVMDVCEDVSNNEALVYKEYTYNNGKLINAESIKLSKIVKAIFNHEIKRDLDLEFDVSGFGTIDITFKKGSKLYEVLLDYLRESSLSINEITIMITNKVSAGKSTEYISVVKNGISLLEFKTKDIVDKLPDVVDILVGILLSNFDDKYTEFIKVLADGIEIDVSSQQNYIKGGLNTLINEDSGMSFIDYLLSGLNCLCKEGLSKIQIGEYTLGDYFPLRYERWLNFEELVNVVVDLVKEKFSGSGSGDVDGDSIDMSGFKTIELNGEICYYIEEDADLANIIDVLNIDTVKKNELKSVLTMSESEIENYSLINVSSLLAALINILDENDYDSVANIIRMIVQILGLSEEEQEGLENLSNLSESEIGDFISGNFSSIIDSIKNLFNNVNWSELTGNLSEVLDLDESNSALSQIKLMTADGEEVSFTAFLEGKVIGGIASLILTLPIGLIGIPATGTIAISGAVLLGGAALAITTGAFGAAFTASRIVGTVALAADVVLAIPVAITALPLVGAIVSIIQVIDGKYDTGIPLLIVSALTLPVSLIGTPATATVALTAATLINGVRCAVKVAGYGAAITASLAAGGVALTGTGLLLVPIVVTAAPLVASVLLILGVI